MITTLIIHDLLIFTKYKGSVLTWAPAPPLPRTLSQRVCHSHPPWPSPWTGPRLWAAAWWCMEDFELKNIAKLIKFFCYSFWYDFCFWKNTGTKWKCWFELLNDFCKKKIMQVLNQKLSIYLFPNWLLFSMLVHFSIHEVCK